MYIFHVDANSAFLSWSAARLLEEGGRTDLRLVPSVVGGDQSKRRGIVLAKSIPAKRLDIRTGETLHEARLKCPSLRIVPPDYELYVRCSDALYALLSEFSPTVQRYSIDECFLAWHGTRDAARDTGQRIRTRVREELGFTVNVGLSCNKLLAKMASELRKPDRMHTLFPEEIAQKMWPLPVGDLFMVGRASLRKLKRLNIRTIGELAHAPRTLLEETMHSHGALIHRYANGLDASRVVPSCALLPQSIGNSTTVAFDVHTRTEAALVLLALCERVGIRLRKARGLARTITISIRRTDFSHASHRTTLRAPTDTTNELYATALTLLDELWDQRPLRHLGVCAGQLEPCDIYQLSLLEGADRERMRHLDATIDALRVRYGEKSLQRGCFLDSGLKPVQGGVNEGNYPMMSSLL